MSQTKNFTAQVFSGTKGYLIKVKGDVNCGMLEVEPTLTKKSPQGINKKVLLLDVYPASNDSNGSFRNADYYEDIQDRYRYTEVSLMDAKGDTIETIRVEQG